MKAMKIAYALYVFSQEVTQGIAKKLIAMKKNR